MPEDPPCPPTEPLPGEAITNPSAFYDLDGDGADEEVFTWRPPIGAEDATWSLRVFDGESQINHDVMAVVKALEEQSEDAGKWIHFGATSYDIVDTARALQHKSAIALLEIAINKLLNACN